jgi:hypothetical protein
VDATIIDAPSSTKNDARARDPEMSSTKKGKDWYFGMKAHVDAESGIVHGLDTTKAKTHDSLLWDEFLHGDETSVWANKGYISATREAAFSGPGKFWGVMRKIPKGGNPNQASSSVQTLNSVNVFSPNVWVRGTSAASQPRAIRILANRGLLLRGSNMRHWPPRKTSIHATKSPAG